MAVHQTSIPGLLVVDWPAFADERGWFRQTYQRSELEEALGRPLPPEVLEAEREGERAGDGGAAFTRISIISGPVRACVGRA